MDKITEISGFVSQYGYMAIFLLVFLQELGVPNPVTNELVLFYAGYLAWCGMLSFGKIFLVTVTADFTGTGILFGLFYMFGSYIEARRPRWFPISADKMAAIKLRMNNRGRGAIFIGRLIPFLRGYVSVGAGLVQIKPVRFLTTVITSAVVWSGGLVALGWALAPYWGQVVKHAATEKQVALILTAVIVLISLGWLANRHYFQKKTA
jgi:membrane protein DedA with SNARE-associated domain